MYIAFSSSMIRVWWGMSISKDFIKAVVGNRYDNPDIPVGVRTGDLRPLTTQN